jgi:hypothetical protein
MANSGDIFRDTLIDEIKSWKLSNIEVYKESWVGERYLGTHRKLDIVVRNKSNNLTIGIEAKIQYSSGSADQKVIYALEDCRRCPIPSIIAFSGDKIRTDLKSKLIDSGLGVSVPTTPTYKTISGDKTLVSLKLTNVKAFKQRVLLELGMYWLQDQKSKIV